MNKRFNTTQVLDAAHDYFLSSKRRVSIEYALMRGINDQPSMRSCWPRGLTIRRQLATSPDSAQPHRGLEVDRLQAGRRTAVPGDPAPRGHHRHTA